MRSRDKNKALGNRLKTARKAAGLTQQQLAESAGYEHYNSISMFESGKRPLDWDKAIALSKALNVSAAYLMGETDSMDDSMTWRILDSETFGITDKLFMFFLESRGYKVFFNCIFVLETRNDNYANGFVEYEDIPRHKVPLSEISFCLSDIQATVTNETGTHEAFIESVTVNEHTIPYGDFVSFIDRIYDFVFFNIDKIKEYTSCNDYYTAWIRNDVSEIAYGIKSESDLKKFAKHHGLEVYSSEEFFELQGYSEEQKEQFRKNLYSDEKEQKKNDGFHILWYEKRG